MPDYARHQTPEYRELHYDRGDNTLSGEPRAHVPAEVKESLDAAYVRAGLKHSCGKCPGAFWDQGKRDAHEAVCGA